MNTQKLKALARRATGGFWIAFINEKTNTFAIHTPDDARCGNIVDWMGFDGVDCSKKQKAHNARFIAASNPAVVIQLIEALEAAERERDELRAEQAEHDEQIARMEGKFSLAKRDLDSKTARCDKAEAELRRHDAAPGEPVGYYRLAEDGVSYYLSHPSEKYDDCVVPLYTAAPPAVLPPEKIIEIMQDAWNEFCDDTGCYPDDFEYQNEKLFFDAGRWAMLVAERISSLGAQQQKVVVSPADSIPDGYCFRLIPAEGTDAFRAACTVAFEEFNRGTGPCGVFIAGHRAMLAAAPAPGGDDA